MVDNINQPKSLFPLNIRESQKIKSKNRYVLLESAFSNLSSDNKNWKFQILDAKLYERFVDLHIIFIVLKTYG